VLRLVIVRELVANVSAMLALCTIAAWDRALFSLGSGTSRRRGREARQGRRLYYWREVNRHGT
jgi:hypothetical protein